MAAALGVAYHELLLFAAVGFAIGGIDDLLVDLLFIARKLWRDSTVYVRYQRMTSDRLPPSPMPGRIAVFIPAWQESGVIGAMLAHALHQWRDAACTLFVGVYPNDPATAQAAAAAAAAAAAGSDRVILCLAPCPGPTTKADCLNVLWRAMLRRETLDGMRFKAVLLHDAEDVVHRDEIRLFDFMIDRFDLVQLPVLPLPGRGGWLRRAIAGHYADEFAESHGKFLTVREALGASIPSAGVACAFDRRVLGHLDDSAHGGPFDPASLTEDYEAGLRLSDLGGRGVFVRMRDAEGRIVATREYFPDTVEAAVRQKARWMVGIALAGCDRLGWRGGPAEWWMRIRDRRSTLAAIILSAAYAALLLWAMLMLAVLFTGIGPPPISSAFRTLLWLNLCLMLWRTGMRAVFVGSTYGWRYGLGSIPRTIIANYIAILAARRALFLYVRSLRGQPLTWDKTHHHFPDPETLA